VRLRTEVFTKGRRGPCATAAELAEMCERQTWSSLVRKMNNDPNGPRPEFSVGDGHLVRHSWYNKRDAVRWMRAQGLLKEKESKQ
jgi:hypothetical protein